MSTEGVDRTFLYGFCPDGGLVFMVNQKIADDHTYLNKLLFVVRMSQCSPGLMDAALLCFLKNKV